MVEGHLRKMHAELTQTVNYYLVLDQQRIALNNYLGQSISLHYQGVIHCVQCGRKTSKSYQQGHCFVCMRRLAECNLCIIHPERCQVEQGHCDPNDWAHAHCDQPHVVYLANSSALKVGITRSSQVPTRWIDQGATQAIPIAAVSNRYRAGIVEVCLKAFVSDTTNWRTMLSGAQPPLDMAEQRDTLLSAASNNLSNKLDSGLYDQIKWLEEPTTTLAFPVLEYPKKVSSLSFDRTPCINGTLLGIKGQYLLLDTGVINLRKFSGYLVSFS